MTALMQTLGDCAVMFAFIAALLFIAGYTFLAKWWKSEIGWARVSLDFGIAVALSPNFLYTVFGINVDNAFFAWYTIGAIAFVGCVSIWNLALVAKAQLGRKT